MAGAVKIIMKIILKCSFIEVVSRNLRDKLLLLGLWMALLKIKISNIELLQHPNMNNIYKNAKKNSRNSSIMIFRGIINYLKNLLGEKLTGKD